MTLYDYYLWNAEQREGVKPLEEYTGPTLFWCDMFHVLDRDGKHVNEMWGPDMTNADLEKYKDYLYCPDFVGGDYVHHSILKPPEREDGP